MALMKLLKAHPLLPIAFFLMIVGCDGVSGADIASTIKGTWKSVCMDLGSNTYIISTATYDGAGTATDKTVFYSDPGCSSPTGLVKSTSSLSYVIGNKVKAVDGTDANEINITINAWQLSQNGARVQGGGAVPTQYDIIAIQGDKLYSSGLSRAIKGPITNPADRPNTLDKTNYYSRQ